LIQNGADPESEASKRNRWLICSIFWNNIRAQVALSIMAFKLQLSIYRSIAREPLNISNISLTDGRGI
jgi:hypothetical protein